MKKTKSQQTRRSPSCPRANQCTRSRLSSNTHIINGIGITCLGALSLLSLALLIPTNHQPQVSALECTSDNPEQCVGQSDLVASALDILVRPAIAVGVQASVQMDITPKLTETWFASETAELTVSTNSNSGYSVYMWTIDGSGDLHSANPHETAAITSITEPTSTSSFAANSWGYRVTSPDSELYNPIPTASGTAIVVSDSSSGDITNDSYGIDFGVNIDSNLPSGQYYNSVVFSAVANPITVSSLYDLTYMQDMTTEVCDNTALHATKQLVDTRDGKSYWVAKLKDGHCWMTQNLALDLSAKRPLSIADSNVTSTYTPSSETNSITLTGASLSSAVTNQWSWDFGKLVLATPAYGVSCGDKITADPNSSESLPAQIARQCGKVGIVDVSDNTKFRPSYQVSEGQSWTFTDNQTVEDTLVSVNCTEWTDDDNLGHVCTAGTYDAHYLLGNYYSWIATTAGTAATTAKNGTVSASICPKGWKLAGGGDNSLTTNGDWAYMMKQYGLVTNATSNSYTGNKIRATVDGEDYYALAFPTYLTVVGTVNAKSGLSDISKTSNYWTSRTGTFVDQPGITDIARNFSLTASTITPNSAPSSRNIGSKIRCIAQ